MHFLPNQLRCQWRRDVRLSGWEVRAKGGALAGLAAAGLVSARAQSFFNPFQAPLPGIPETGVDAGAGLGAGDDFQITRGVPYNPTGGGRQHDYNFKFGPVSADLSASLSAYYSDNINLVASGSGLKQEGDLTLYPSVGVAFQWPVNRDTMLRFDVGVGYYLSINHPEFNHLGLNLTPGSSWSYQFPVGDVRVTLFDRLATTGSSGNGTQRSDLSGTGSSSSVQFNRFSNSSGISAAWQPTRRTTFSVGYTLDFDYGLNDSFAFSDHLTHSLSAAMFQRLNARWTAGISASAFLNEYLQGIQNNSTGYGVGPLVTWRPSRFLNFSGSVRYNVAQIQSTGAIADRNGSGGVGYDFSVQHIINRRISHSLSVSSGIELGVGANFNQAFTISYRASWQLTQRLALSISANRQSFTQSGAGYDFYIAPAGSKPDPADPLVVILPDGTKKPLPAGSLHYPGTTEYLLYRPAEEAETYNFTAGTAFALTRKLSASVGYAHTLKVSKLAFHDYDQNTYSLSLNYRF